ncbi:MAG: type II 3-dehydroquinate dehydratase [Candidatus Kappaea frigidicola]|nr:type II 3-dehydroquinate dehydratase [Candidatus Kappaea frigidicola]
MTKVLLIHGPNLNLLGQREPEVYGKATIEEINQEAIKEAEIEGISIEIMQSNHEGEIVDIIGKAKDNFEGIIINPAAYTHTSVAIRDAISAAGIPAIEVHLSNIYAREEFRHTSLIAPVALGQISGFGKYSYILAVKAIAKTLKK